jgi:hypothetical protein
MAADDHIRRRGGKRREQAVSACRAGEDLDVVAGCRMAKQRLPEACDVELLRGRPLSNCASLIGIQPLSRPVDHVAEAFRDLADVTTGEMRSHDAVAVSMDEPHRRLECHEA